MKSLITKFLIVVALGSPLGIAFGVVFVPLIAAGMAGGATSATSFVSFLNLSAWIVGGSLAYLSMGGSPTAPETEIPPISVQLNTGVPLATPAGWNPAVSPAVQPSPPSPISQPTLPTISVVLGSSATTLSGAMPATCTLYLNTGVPVGQTSRHVMKDTVNPSACAAAAGLSSFGQANSPDNHYVFAAAFINNCPAGYTASGSNCVVSDANLVQKPSDGKCTIVRTGNSFSGDSRDPDCASGSLPSTVTVSPTVVEVKPTLTETQKVVINPDGSTTITSTRINSNNTTTTETITVSPGNGTPGSTVITGRGSVTVSGSGTQAGTTPIDFPTDYNREATQQSINSKLGEIKAGQCGGTGQPKCDVKVDETGTPTEAALQAQKDAYDSAAAARVAQIEGVGQSVPFTFGLSISWPSATCQDIPIGNGRGVTGVVPICARAGDIQNVVSFIVSIFTAFALFFIGASAIRGS